MGARKGLGAEEEVTLVSSYSRALIAMREGGAGFEMPYERPDGVKTTHGTFRVWRSLPVKIRMDIISIVWNALVGTGDIHLRNGGRALIQVIEWLNVATTDEWPVRPLMPGDPETEEKVAHRQRLKIEMEDTIEHLKALKDQLEELG